jgi:hypothetical protein
MKKDKFIVTNLIKDFIISIDKYLTNFPNKELELKRTLKETSYELLKMAYRANCTEDMNKRRNLQDEMIAQIKYLDFVINLCYDKQLINSKKYLKFGESLDYIIKYVIGWRKSVKE